jgi:hypothetical protein
MLTVHPQRWNPFGPAWCQELLLQKAKNLVKRFIASRRQEATEKDMKKIVG